MELVAQSLVAEDPGGANPDGQPAGSCQQMSGMFVPILLMFAIIYFLIIRPQQKQQKRLQLMLSELKRGDKVITNAGIFGSITGLTDHTATLEVAKNVHIKVLRSQIAGLQPTEKDSEKGPVVPEQERK